MSFVLIFVGSVLFLNCLSSVVYSKNFIFWVLYLRLLHHTLQFLETYKKKHFACNSLTKTKCPATQFNKLGISFTETICIDDLVTSSASSSILKFRMDT